LADLDVHAALAAAPGGPDQAALIRVHGSSLMRAKLTG
jgi:hypothetical protein